MRQGHIIMLNGAAASGKSIIASALQAAFDRPHAVQYFDVAVLDSFFKKLPLLAPGNAAVFKQELFRLIKGSVAAAAAIASAGSNVIVELAIQEPDWMQECLSRFEDFDVLFVGLKCPDGERERRVAARGNGMRFFREQSDWVHSHGDYDIELDTCAKSVEECVSLIVTYVESGNEPQAFRRLRTSH